MRTLASSADSPSTLMNSCGDTRQAASRAFGAITHNALAMSAPPKALPAPPLGDIRGSRSTLARTIPVRCEHASQKTSSPIVVESKRSAALAGIRSGRRNPLHEPLLDADDPRPASSSDAHHERLPEPADCDTSRRYGNAHRPSRPSTLRCGLELSRNSYAAEVRRGPRRPPG